MDYGVYDIDFIHPRRPSAACIAFSSSSSVYSRRQYLALVRVDDLTRTRRGRENNSEQSFHVHLQAGCVAFACTTDVQNGGVLVA